jgi:hypothetical protein
MKPTLFDDGQSLFNSLRHAFKHHKSVFFNGSYQIPQDPLVTDKERVQMVAYEVWKVSGYWFRYVYQLLLEHG